MPVDAPSQDDAPSAVGAHGGAWDVFDKQDKGVLVFLLQPGAALRLRVKPNLKVRTFFF
jgi:hypothetical protein